MVIFVRGTARSDTSVGSFVRILRSQTCANPVARAGRMRGSWWVRLCRFFSRIGGVLEASLALNFHQDQHVPDELTKSRAGGASCWRRTIKSYASSGTNRVAIGFVARRFGQIYKGAGLGWFEPRRAGSVRSDGYPISTGWRQPSTCHELRVPGIAHRPNPLKTPMFHSRQNGKISRFIMKVLSEYASASTRWTRLRNTARALRRSGA
jgi:hypothetical protein